MEATNLMSVQLGLFDLLQMHVMNYVTVYFGFIAATYFVVPKLPTVTYVAILLVFTLFTALNISSIADLSLKVIEMQELYSDGLPKRWRGGGPLENWAGNLQGLSLVLIYICSYTSGIGFAMYMRKKAN